MSETLKRHYDPKHPYWFNGEKRYGAYDIATAYYPKARGWGSFTGAPKIVSVHGVITEHYPVADGDVWTNHRPLSRHRTNESSAKGDFQNYAQYPQRTVNRQDPINNRAFEPFRVTRMPNDNLSEPGSDKIVKVKPEDTGYMVIEKPIMTSFISKNRVEAAFQICIARATTFKDTVTGETKVIAIDTDGITYFLDLNDFSAIKRSKSPTDSDG